MSTEKVVLIAVTESTAQKIAFKEGGKVKAKAATKYLFKVEDGDVAPENITVKRVGNDLQVSFEGSEKPDLTIEGFFDQGMDGQLYGVSEDNLLYGYVRTDGEGFPGPLLMADGESAPLALGGQGVPYQATMVEAAGFALWPLLLGLAGLTAATAAIINHKDGDGDDPKTSQAPTNLVATDDVGPVQGPLVNGDTTDDSHPVISGNGLPGAVIHVFDNGTEVGSTTVANDGTWTFTPNLPDGPHDIDVTQEVPGQKPSKPENVVDIVVDTIAPPAPKAELDPASDSGIKGDNITNDTTPTIDGKTEAGATVTVIFPSGESITAKADENGNWSVTPTKPLPEGKGDITVIATDTAGNESQPTVISVLIDTKAEQAKTWLDPNSDSGTKGDNLTNDTTPAIDGTSEPGATVIVTFPTGESVTAKVDANGNWSVTPTKPLPEGKNDISVVVRDVAGNQSESKESVAVNGSTSGANQGDVVTLTVNNKTFTAMVGADGKWTTNVPGSDLVADLDHMVEAAITVQGRTAVADKSYEVDLTPPRAELRIDAVTGDGIVNSSEAGSSDNVVAGQVSGEFMVGDVVSFTLNGHAYSAAVDVNGKWSVTQVAGADLVAGAGVHAINATAVVHDAAGNATSLNASQPYVVDLRSLSVLIETIAGDNVINLVESQGKVAIKGTTSGTNEGDVVTLTINNKQFTTTVNAKGNWSTKIAGSVLVKDADHVVQAVVTAHGETARTDKDYTVDLSPPKAELIIETVAGDNIVNASEAGRSDNVVSGKVTGEFTVGDLVTFTLNGHAYSAAVDATGNWSAQNVAGADLAAGLGNARVISASVKLHDAAGNEGAASATHLYYVQTTLPAATLQIDTVAGDNVVDPSEATSTNLSVTGTSTGARAGDVVTLVINKQTYSTTVGADGKWAVTGVKGSDLLADSDRVVDGVLHATDIAGNFVDVRATQTYEIWSNSVRIAGMSKDSAIDLAHSTDFITADGTAGRGVYGTIGQTLTGNQTVQVSFDGGANWTNAVTNGLDWAAVDTGAHYSNWSIQARIADAGVAQGVATVQNVAYLGSLGTAPTITNIPDAVGGYSKAKAADGSDVNVSLAGTLAKAGDVLHIVWANTTYDQVLTAADIASGTATARIPASALSAQDTSYDFKVSAQVITTEGQISPPSNAYSVQGAGTSGGGVADGLGGTPMGNVYYGQGFTISSNSTLSHLGNTSTSVPGLYIPNPSYNYFQFNFTTEVRGFSVYISGLENDHLGSSMQIFDTSGKSLLSTTVAADGLNGIWSSKYFTYKASEGVSIGSVKLYADDALSGLVVSDLYLYQTTHTADPNATGQTVIDHSWETYFDDNSNTSHVVSMTVDPTAYFAQGTAHVHGGAAMDTLKLTGANQVLDLRSLTGDNDQAKISSIEKFDITGTGNNTLKLSINDVLNLGETNMFQRDGKVQVMVDGNAGDKVELSGLHDHGASSVTWKNAGTATISGATYQVYNSSQLDAEVLIKQTVTATLV